MKMSQSEHDELTFELGQKFEPQQPDDDRSRIPTDSS